MDENDCSPNFTVLSKLSETITNIKQIKESTRLNTVSSNFLESTTPRGSGGRSHQEIQKELAKPVGNRCVNSKRKCWEAPSVSGIQELWIIGQY